jgi:ATP-binding cassette subfamily F protein uup
MLAQRGADLTGDRRRQEPQKVAKEPASAVAERQPTKRRMSFKDKHALETLPKTIAALQAEAGELQARLDDPQFYARDRAAFEKITAALGELQHKIAAAEEQWLELEMLREELAGG